MIVEIDNDADFIVSRLVVGFGVRPRVWYCNECSERLAHFMDANHMCPERARRAREQFHA